MADAAKISEPIKARAPARESTLERGRSPDHEASATARELGALPAPVSIAGDRGDASLPVEVPGGTLLVERDAAPGQWTKREFLDRVRHAIHDAAAQELAGTDWTVEHCPWFEYWYSYYERRSARDIEAALYKYAPQAMTAASAADYVDPLVSRIRSAVARWRATGEIDSPPAEIPKEIVTQAALGPGRPLDSATRTRMEQAMDTSLASIRLHDDPVAADVVSSQQARALALGSHVAFASGQYRPGTVVGDAMLAHELAHTQQQGTTPIAGGAPDAVLEGAADRHAMGIFARLRLGMSSVLGNANVPSTGLRLQRCRVNVGEKDVPDLPADKAVPKPAVPVQTSSTLDLSKIPTVDLDKHKSAAADSLLFITGTRQGSSDRQLFIVPAAGFVLEGEAPPPAGIVDQPPPPATTGVPATTTKAPTTLMAIPAAGHAGVHLINTGEGAGILLDVAGTANDKGTPDVLVSEGLLRLQAELGITRVDGAFISHGHADHAGALEWMVKNGNITGSTVWLMPGMEDFTNGPLGRELTKLGEGNVSPQFPKGWKATPLNAQPLADTPTVTTATLEVGEATLKMAVGTKELKKFVEAATTKDWAKAKGLADAATPLTHISWEGTDVEAVVVGDLRGTTIRNLADRLGDAEFREFVGNARVVIGLHHLGAIKSSPDVEGLRRLLGAMGGGAEPITVLAQVGPEHAVNERLVRALQIAGARVITVDKPDPDNPNAGIKVHSTGEVEQQGGTVADIDPTTKAAQDRLQTIERAQRTLEQLSDFRGVPDATREQVIEGLKTEAKRLRDLLSARQNLSTKELHLEKQSETNVKDLAANETALGRTEGMEQRAAGVLSDLALSPEDLATLVKELQSAESEGTTSTKLRELLGRVDRTMAKQILMEETTGEPESRAEKEEMWERVEARLEEQADTEAALQITEFPAAAKAPAYLGLFLQAFELATPAIEQWAKSRDDAEHEDFYMFYRELLWWNEKGILLPYKWSPTMPEADLKQAVQRRMFDDAHKGKHADPPKDLEKATPLKMLWVESLDQWDQAARAQFFETLRVWMDLHVRSVEDYYAELKTGIPAPIKPKNEHDLFGDWQIHVGVVEGGHVHSAWQTSETLTTIMKATMNRATQTTQSQIDARVKSIGAQPKSSGVATAGIPSTSSVPASASHGATVGRLRVTAKKAKIYTLLDGAVTDLGKSAERRDGFHFLELSGKAPDGYVWVSPGDSETALSLGALVGMQFRREVKIPKATHITDYNDPDFKGYGEAPPHRYMNAEQLEAWSAYTAGVPGYYFHAKEEGNFRGTISIYEKGPMVGGMVLMRRSDLGPDS